MPDHEPDRPQAPDRSSARDSRTGRSAAAARIEQQQTWVDLQIRQAMERGAFENLPGAGKPIEGLGAEHDPDWWLKQLVEREKISVLPPALALRKEDAELDQRLDRYHTESEVRREVEDFNARVIRARYTPVDGPAADHDAARRRRHRRGLARASRRPSYGAGRGGRGRRDRPRPHPAQAPLVESTTLSSRRAVGKTSDREDPG